MILHTERGKINKQIMSYTYYNVYCIQINNNVKINSL